MADEDSNQVSSNLKVPPLKIVLSSHQNNAFINIRKASDDQYKSMDKSDNAHDSKEFSQRNNIDKNQSFEKHSRRNAKGSPERNEQESFSSRAEAFPSPSSSTSSSDRSNSTTPSSESESLASNSTIISDQQHQQAKVKEEANSAIKDDKQERIARFVNKTLTNDRVTSNQGGSSKRGPQDGVPEQSLESTPVSKEQSLNANQRITRSSQRAAQLNKSENSGDLNCDDTNGPENQEKLQETARKAKRRKVELQEGEQDGCQTTAQPAVVMANFYPADYQLPSHNSFELYRDIRKEPYKKLMKLSHIQPKVPHGFKDYLLNNGPYLLDGNKLGVGLNGCRSDNNCDNARNSNPTSRGPLRMKLTILHKISNSQPSHQRHTNYPIPKLTEPPKSLQVNSPLYELFQDQEKARYQMRVQHLKERERSILAAEQEILRTYNRAAIADRKQKLHLSACTYFYYQERYHYIDDKSDPNGTANSKEVPHCQDNSFLCIEGGEANKSNDTNLTAPKVEVGGPKVASEDPKVPDKQVDDGSIVKIEPTTLNATDSNGISEDASSKSISNPNAVESQTSESVFDVKLPTETNGGAQEIRSSEATENGEVNLDKSNSNTTACKGQPETEMSEQDLKEFNKEIFLTQLQEIDDKWDKIKKDMLVRHKNEADSLYAVQSLEWEWKAKEIGACDVRLSLKIESEYVPRVEVMTLDY